MERRFTWAAGLLMVLVGIGVGVISYNSGVEHGLAMAAASADLPARSLPPYMWHGPWAFGLGPLYIRQVLATVPPALVTRDVAICRT